MEVTMEYIPGTWTCLLSSNCKQKKSKDKIFALIVKKKQSMGNFTVM